MRYLTNTVETVAILCFAPFAIVYGVVRMFCSAVLLVGVQILDVWAE